MTQLQSKMSKRIRAGKSYKTYLFVSDSGKVQRIASRDLYSASISLFNRFGNSDFSLIKIC